MSAEQVQTVYGKISSAFSSAKLAELCLEKVGVQTGPFGSQLHNEDYVEKGTPIITVEHLSDNRILHKNTPKVSDADRVRLSKYSLTEGDIVFSRVGSVDRRALVRQQEEGWLFSGRCLRVRPKPEIIDSAYLSYFFGHEGFRSHIRGIAVGATMPSINTKILSNIPIYYPELNVQRRIACVLSSLDDKIELNRQINQTLEQMAQAIFKSWFVDFDPVHAKVQAIKEGRDPIEAAARVIGNPALERVGASLREIAELFPSEFVESELGLIPKGWEVTNFGAVSTCYDKYRIPLSRQEREKRKGSIPYYGATSVMDYVDEAIFDGVYLLLGEDGSVVKENGTPFVQYIWGKSWVNNHAHVLQGANGLSTEQLMLFVSMQNISAYVTGAVQLKLNQKNMNSIPFTKATSSINKSFSEIISSLYSKYRTLVEESLGLTLLRDTLLPKLLSGEIRVGDAEQQVYEVT